MIYRTEYRLTTLIFATASLLASGCGAQETSKVAPTSPAAIPTIPRELDDFIARPEPLYKWVKTANPIPAVVVESGDAMVDMMVQTLGSGAQTTQLTLTSQEWQGKPWTHHLSVIRPAKVTHPDTALLLITYGSGSAEELALAKVVANLTGAPVAVLGDVPNQPLFGLSEDALIAHTFAKYLETGDANWPLLFPMTKSAVKSMDAISEFSTKEWKAPIKKFVVTGASKRGWTSWLSAAADKRVVGIMPMVYNNLNLPLQMPHQIEVWGSFSKSISDYTELNLPAALATPRGQQLGAMVDPWTYRQRFTMPKFIVNAANDSYWPLDALDLYRAGLPGQTDVLHVPNAKHSMSGEEIRVFGSLSNWFSRLLAGKAAPKVELTSQIDAANGAAKVSLRVIATEKINTARLWTARSATRDFRASRWQSSGLKELQHDGKQTAAQIAVPAGTAELPYAAVFAEIDVPQPGALVPLRLSSDVIIWKAQPDAGAK